MGTLLDTAVLIHLERRLAAVPAEEAQIQVMRRLGEVLGDREELAIAMITASELLHGVHRADPERRSRRHAFVEAVLDAFPPVPFDLLAARAHARLWAELAVSGSDIGPHDRLVAATALALGWRLATTNLRHFARVSGLDVVAVDLAG